MKKLLLLLLSVLTLFSFTACLGMDGNDSGSIDFDYEVLDFVRLKDFSPNEASNIVITTSLLEYENFLDYMKFYMPSDAAQTVSVDPESKKYNADFFASHDLIFIYTEDELSTVNTVTDVKYSATKGEISVELSKAVSQSNAEGPKFRLILISVPKTGFSDSSFSVTKFVQTSSSAKTEAYTNVSVVTGITDGAIFSTAQLSDGSTERFIFDISYDDSLKVGDRIITVCNTRYSDGKNNYYCDPVYFRKYSDKAENNLSFESFLYFYPKTESLKLKVEADIDGMMFTSFPEATSGAWNVTAMSDGFVTDDSGAEYGNVSWSGFLNTEYDLSAGYCIAADNVQTFMTEKAAEFGLSDAEVKDFASYWTKKLQDSPYFYVSFTSDPNSSEVTYNVSEKPDSAVRLYVVAVPLEKPIDLSLQKASLKALSEKEGFRISEWGGIVLPSAVLSGK